MKFGLTGLFALAVSLEGMASGIVPYRYGAIHYPDEEIAFQLPYGVKAWRVTDMDDVECGHGEAKWSVVSFRGGQIRNRFGAFKFEALDGDGKPIDSIWFARLTSKDVRPCSWVGVGTHDHHGWIYGDMRPVDLMAAAGIGVVRDEPLWERCECRKGQYTLPHGFEDYVEALRAKGIRMNMLVTYGCHLYENPCDPVAYSRYAAFLADCFKGRVDRFEIFNEPQNFMFRKLYGVKYDSGVAWVKKFVELANMADDAIRKVNPDAIVAVTGEDVEYFLDMMITNGVARAHNAISFHPYCHTQHRPEREYFLKDFGAKHRALAKAHGGADRWIVTEAGWSTFQGKGEFWEIAGCYPKASYAGQAECIVRMYLSALEAGCEYACQYDFMNDGANPQGAEDNFGLVHQDGTPKPSFAAVAYLTRLLGQATFRRDLAKDPVKYRIAEFVKNGQAILAAWCIEGNCDWEIPEAFGPLVDCRDLCGNPQPVPVIEGRRIKLTERPLYLLGK